MDISDNIKSWIDTFLSVPHPIFNNLPPCPYAKKAWAEERVLVKEIKDPVEYNLQTSMSNYGFLWPDADVVIFAFDPNKITAYDLKELVDKVQRRVLDAKGLVALEDHPDDEEAIESVVLNNGDMGLVLVQPRKKLEEARKHLDALGYYRYWPEEYKSEVQAR
jgi:hypothetical protein